MESTLWIKIWHASDLCGTFLSLLTQDISSNEALFDQKAYCSNTPFLPFPTFFAPFRLFYFAQFEPTSSINSKHCNPLYTSILLINSRYIPLIFYQFNIKSNFWLSIGVGADFFLSQVPFPGNRSHILWEPATKILRQPYFWCIKSNMRFAYTHTYMYVYYKL